MREMEARSSLWAGAGQFRRWGQAGQGTGTLTPPLVEQQPLRSTCTSPGQKGKKSQRGPQPGFPTKACKGTAPPSPTPQLPGKGTGFAKMSVCVCTHARAGGCSPNEDTAVLNRNAWHGTGQGNGSSFLQPP